MWRGEGNAVLYVKFGILVEKKRVQMPKGWSVPMGEKKRTR